MSKLPADSINLLVNRQSGRLVAADSSACEFFKTDPKNLDSLILADLCEEFEVTRWDALLDQNDNQAIEFETVFGPQHNPVATSVRVVAFRGFQPELLLLSLQFGTAAGTILGYRDALTGLPDRRELQVRFESIEKSVDMQQKSIAIVFLDLDQFKEVNDRYGHAVGDQVLASLAARWSNCVRDDDLMVRYGGDEFVLLLSNISSREATLPILLRLTTVSEEPLVVGPHRVQVGVTLGVAVSDSQQALSLEQLVEAADRDMYKAKKSRN